MLVNRKTNYKRFISKLGSITNDINFALDIKKEEKINQYIIKYINEFRIYILDSDGIVIKSYR